MDVIARLLAGSVQDGDCRIWTKCLATSGYGKISYKSRSEMTHRVSYLVNHGPIPAGISVLHKCDRRACIEPGHLFLGDNSANMQDMSHKFRGRDQKLSTADRADIRAAYAVGNVTQRALAARYGVSQPLINRVVSA